MQNPHPSVPPLQGRTVASPRVALFGADSSVLCRTAIYLHASGVQVVGAVCRKTPHGIGKRRWLLHAIERTSRSVMSLLEPYPGAPLLEPYRFPTLATVARIIPAFERVDVRSHNDPETIAWLTQKEVAVVLLLGTGIIKEPTLKVVRIGFLNAHSALLPKYRGAKSEFWMMLNRDFSALGVTIHWVTPGLDEGRILVQKPVAYALGDTPERLRAKTDEIKPMLFDEALRMIAAGRGEGVPQDEARATRFSRPTLEDVKRFEEMYPSLRR